MQSITFDANTLNLAYREKLQHELDIVHFTYSCIDSYSDEKYERVETFPLFYPSKEEEMSPKVTRDACKEKALTSFLVDCVNITAGFLEECYILCYLFRIGNREILDQATIDHFNTAKGKFHKAGFPEKFTSLRDEFGVVTELEYNFMSLNATRNCLVHRNGIITEKDTDSSGMLKIMMRAIQIYQSSPDGQKHIPLTKVGDITNPGWSVGVRAVNETTTFRIGEQVTFGIEMLPNVSFTLVMMANEIVQSVDAFGASTLA